MVAEVAVLLLLLLLLQPRGGRSEPQGDGAGEGDAFTRDLSPNTEVAVSSSYSCLDAGRKMKSGLLLSRETGERLSEVDVSSELCEDG